MKGWIEIFQPEATRRQMSAGALSATSRLDRAYILLPAALALDRYPAARMVGRITASCGTSDHTPLQISIATARPPGRRDNIPAWLCKRPEFEEFVRLMVVHLPCDGSPLE
eukprot:1514673-Alexandrium_andersonii.AAC.1